MMLGKIGFGLGMLVVAAMSFVHSAAEVSPRALGVALETPTTLSATALSERVDVFSRASLGMDEESGGLTVAPLPDTLLADARNAFVRDPLEVTNARVLALGSPFASETDRFAAMERVNDLSQRDSITLVWLSQQYALAEDVDALLGSVDALLRTDNGARAQAVGTLVGVLASPEGDVRLGELIRAEPEWEDDFWQAFARSPAALEYGPRFFRESGLEFTRINPRWRTIYVQELVDAGAIDKVIEIIRLSPDVGEGASDLAAGEFVAGTGENPLDWRTTTSGNFVARIVPSTSTLEVDARPGSFGPAASRIVEFSGTSELEMAMAQPVPDRSQLTLTAICADGEPRELGSIVLGPGQAAGRTAIAAGGCGFGLLTLAFRVEEGREGAIFEVGSIALR